MGKHGGLRAALRSLPGVRGAFLVDGENRAGGGGGGIRDGVPCWEVVDGMTRLYGLLYGSGPRSGDGGVASMTGLDLVQRWVAPIDRALRSGVSVWVEVWDQPSLVPQQKRAEQARRDAARAVQPYADEACLDFTEGGLCEYVMTADGRRTDQPRRAAFPFRLDRVLATRSLRRRLYDWLRRGLSLALWGANQGRVVLDYACHRLYVMQMAPDGIFADTVWLEERRVYGEADLQCALWLERAPPHVDILVNCIDTDYMLILSAWHEQRGHTRTGRVQWVYSNEARGGNVYLDLARFVRALQIGVGMSTGQLVVAAVLCGTDYLPKLVPNVGDASVWAAVQRLPARTARLLEPGATADDLIALIHLVYYEYVKRSPLTLCSTAEDEPLRRIGPPPRSDLDQSNRPLPPLPTGRRSPPAVDYLREMWPLFQFNIRYWTAQPWDAQRRLSPVVTYAFGAS